MLCSSLCTAFYGFTQAVFPEKSTALYIVIKLNMLDEYARELDRELNE